MRRRLLVRFVGFNPTEIRDELRAPFLMDDDFHSLVEFVLFPSFCDCSSGIRLSVLNGNSGNQWMKVAGNAIFSSTPG